jgi:hypothetical protein
MAKLVNRLETLPREILCELLERLPLRDIIRALTSINDLDSDTADYLCSRAHKCNFGPALNEISTIQHTIGIKLISRGPGQGFTQFEKSVRIGQGAFIQYEFETDRNSLSIATNKPWPVKMPWTDSSVFSREYIKKYVQEFEESNWVRMIAVRGNPDGKRLNINFYGFNVRKTIYPWAMHSDK